MLADGDIVYVIAGRNDVQPANREKRLRLTIPTGEADTEPGRAWELTVYDNKKALEKRVISSDGSTRQWEALDIDLKEFAGRETTLRLYQRVFVRNRTAGNALWRNVRIR